MDEATRAETLRDRLARFGDPRETHRWPDRKPDYVAALGVTEADVPTLLAEARRWADETDPFADESDVAVFAPVHAWRAAAQLGAVEAVPVLLGMMSPLDALDDELFLEEFPPAFALIGPAAFEPLAAYLDDESREPFARICAAHSLVEITYRHTHLRDDATRALRDRLERFERQDETLNAFLVGYLMELRATEAAETIERAYAADRVDLMITGPWNTVREELGVEGLGLVPPELADRSPTDPALREAIEAARAQLAESSPPRKRYKRRKRKSR